MSDMPELGSPFVFPGGRRAPNRFCKAALSESLCDPTSNTPNRRHFRLYKRWAAGGAGTIITGNVMVDRRYLENPRNVVLDSISPLEPFKQWAISCKAHGALAIMQISHPGRQCPLSVTWSPVAPSPIRVKLSVRPPHTPMCTHSMRTTARSLSHRPVRAPRRSRPPCSPRRAR